MAPVRLRPRDVTFKNRAGAQVTKASKTGYDGSRMGVPLRLIAPIQSEPDGRDGAMASTGSPEVYVYQLTVQCAITVRAFVVNDGLDSVCPELPYRFCDRLERKAALHTPGRTNKGDERADAQCHSRHSEDNETTEHDRSPPNAPSPSEASGGPTRLRSSML